MVALEPFAKVKDLHRVVGQLAGPANALDFHRSRALLREMGCCLTWLEARELLLSLSLGTRANPLARANYLTEYSKISFRPINRVNHHEFALFPGLSRGGCETTACE